MEDYKLLSGAALKNIALTTMVIDHVNKAFVAPNLPSAAPIYLTIIVQIMYAVGRFAFPIFCFLMVEGFYHTRSRSKYLRNLLVFAVISEIPFNLFISASIFSPDIQNIFFTLAISYLSIWGIDICKNKTKYWLWFVPIFTALGIYVQVQFRGDYGSKGIIIPIIFYLLRQKPFVASVVAYFPLFKTPWSLVGSLLTTLYNGERGRQIKWLNYWVYPTHLAIIGIIRFLTL